MIPSFCKSKINETIKIKCLDPLISISGNMISSFPNETVPFNVLQNLENINSEIREIWSQLSKQHNEGIYFDSFLIIKMKTK